MSNTGSGKSHGAAARHAPRLQAREGAGRRLYDRARDLPALLPMWPHEIGVTTLEAHGRLLKRLHRALRIERQRGVAGHWSYDVARHRALAGAAKAEAQAFRSRGGRDQPKRT
jgi:uncharacterized protein YcaQ